MDYKVVLMQLDNNIPSQPQQPEEPEQKTEGQGNIDYVPTMPPLAEHADYRKNRAATIIAATLIIIAMASAIYLLEVHTRAISTSLPPNSNITKAYNSTNTTTTIHTVVSYNSLLPRINESMVLYGLTNISNYTEVSNFTFVYYDSSGKYNESTSTYSLWFVLPIVAPEKIIPINLPINYPLAYSKYPGPLSSEVTVLRFDNETAASSYYYKNIVASFKSQANYEYLSPLGKPVNVSTPDAVHVKETYTPDNTSAYDAFISSISNLYNGTGVQMSMVARYKNFIVYCTNLGLASSYNSKYLYNITQNTINDLGSYS